MKLIAVNILEKTTYKSRQRAIKPLARFQRPTAMLAKHTLTPYIVQNRASASWHEYGHLPENDNVATNDVAATC